MLQRSPTAVAVVTILCSLSVGGWLLAVSDDATPTRSAPVTSRGTTGTTTIARIGAVSRTLPDKLAEMISVKDFGATGDGRTDDTIAFQAALDCGAQRVLIPEGVYVTTGLEIKETSVLTTLQGIGKPVIRLTTGRNRVALTCNKSQFVNLKDFTLESSGTKDDGNATVGILAVSKSYYSLSGLRFANFSARGLQVKQCVYWGLEDMTAQSCTYGLSFETNQNIPCSTVTVSRAYITGCTRGLSFESAVLVALNSCVLEYCGSKTTNDGALHFAGGGANMSQLYFEANYRNLFASDAAMIFNGLFELTAEAPNIVNFVGTAFDRRGALRFDHHQLGAARIGPDQMAGYDLTIGTNLVAPLAGGSVRWGDTTKETIQGKATAGSWTTIKSIPEVEMTGPVNSRAHYEYAVYGGTADLGTGFDSGTILNGVMRSHSGTVPAWLRLDASKDIQIKLDSSSYGLSYKIVLTRVYPG